MAEWGLEIEDQVGEVSFSTVPDPDRPGQDRLVITFEKLPAVSVEVAKDQEPKMLVKGDSLIAWLVQMQPGDILSEITRENITTTGVRVIENASAGASSSAEVCELSKGTNSTEPLPNVGSPRPTINSSQPGVGEDKKDVPEAQETGQYATSDLDEIDQEIEATAIKRRFWNYPEPVSKSDEHRHE